MKQAAHALEPTSPLCELLSQEFSEGVIQRLGGAQAVRSARQGLQKSLERPLSDFLSRPGKEFRNRLVSFGWELGGKRGPVPQELGLIVEVLHAGSLIIDDIEDGSVYRRGAPALHVTYGLPTALNAGNWLYFWALALLERLELPPATELSLHRHVSRTLLACHEGQALDLSTAIHDVPQREVPGLVLTTTRMKTGKLMELAVVLGAVAAGASQAHARSAAEFGSALGVGLQMLDDLSGIISEQRCHKGHEDLCQGRPTWPWAWIAEDLDAVSFGKLRELSARVQANDLHPEELAERLREHLGSSGKSRAHSHLHAAVARLRSLSLEARLIQEIENEIALLERCYDT